MTDKQTLKYGINCDMGEDIRSLPKDLDTHIMPLIDSCNVACGYHGSSIDIISNTIDLAIKHNVTIGAHPSYHDPERFGRRYIDLTHHALCRILEDQIYFLKEIIESKGGKLSYIKPHGALYHAISINDKESSAIIDTITSIDKGLSLMGLPNSKGHKKAQKTNIPYIIEAFGDRLYDTTNTLVPRNQKNAVISKPELIVSQIESLIDSNQVICINGDIAMIKADSICVHSDNPATLDALKLLRGKNSNPKTSVDEF